MPLESCMIIVDNSEYMRNGDYPPTRFQAQTEAVQTIFLAKTDVNPESAVGLMTMAGKSPSLLVTPTNNLGHLLHSLSKVLVSSVPQLSTAISIAQLALKHRENKNQRQRIIVFVGSPLEESKDGLVKLGKRLRKNNVGVDVVTFGQEGMGNDEKLGALVEAVGDDSHLVSAPPGERFLGDVIAASPILFDGEHPVAGGSGEFDGEVDPNLDPELAMAIRMSLQEAQSQPQTQPVDINIGPSATTLPPSTTQPVSSQEDVLMAPGDEKDPSESKPSAQAASSKNDAASAISSDSNQVTKPLNQVALSTQDKNNEELAKTLALGRGEDVEMEDEDEEAAIARAIAMSLEGQGEDKKEPSK
ncbi:hypothetical protein L204_102754 [Cryptococcus depauperatus]|nr:26S proteasome regulatory subunit N10 [Cryptococcus depauperatus CBS 7855]